MEAVHAYSNTSYSTMVSRIKRQGRCGDHTFTIHHTLKYGQPFVFWFSIYHVNTGYADIDIRKINVFENEDSKNRFMKLHNRKRLNEANYLISQMQPDNFINTLEKFQKKITFTF